MSALELPQLPVPHEELVRHIAKNPDVPMVDLIHPYRQYEAQLRHLYAQDADNEALKNGRLNVFPLFTADTPEIKVRARDLAAESETEKGRYIMTLPDDQRRLNGSPAVVQSHKEFRHNFNVFSESSLTELDWDNVVASGFCPASDVDLFLYGMTEEEAIKKISQIETMIRDSILTETTTVRTKNAITICSQYPTRHIQIVLRIYKNVSEILTGFDIDCSGAAYDGKQVYCTPRALQSYITQINHIDLSRRSPSYENRLSKYSHRGFEVYWPNLDRSRIDPTIFERSFRRTLGLARLLVLERLPTSSSRDQYLAKRREERGRPPLSGRRYIRRLGGNIKDAHEDEVAEWVNEDDVSNYHTFTVPYGINFHAKKIEKLCYTKDLLLNAEWNQPKDREVYLHRHPAFFGRFDDVKGDCCGFCPKPVTNEEKEVHEQESKIYVSGKVSFIRDDPGRQLIGSFNPLTSDDWTEMAYVGNTARLCQDIVDGELSHVEDWLSREGSNPNTRDYTGRTPLHLAVTNSTSEIVKCLVDHGARLVARLADGRTALHLAAERGDIQIVKILMDKSNANEAEEEEKQARKRCSQTAESVVIPSHEEDATEEDESDLDVVSGAESDEEDQKSMATGSFVKVKKGDENETHETAVPEEDEDSPDFYDVNVVAWDTPCSALHLAIICGHDEVVKFLCQEYGADILLPVKLHDQDNKPTAAILTLVLATKLPIEKAKSMTRTILSLGATCAQADFKGMTAFQSFVDANASELIEVLLGLDKIGVKNSINHINLIDRYQIYWPLEKAIRNGDPRLILQLLDAGAGPHLEFDTWLESAKHSGTHRLRLQGTYEDNTGIFRSEVEQPIILAIQFSDPSVTLELLNRGADVNTMTRRSAEIMRNNHGRESGQLVLDLVREQLKCLRKYEPPAATPPELKHGMDEFLGQFKKGTWQHAAVRIDAAKVKRENERKLKAYETEKARIASLEGVHEKQAEIDSVIARLEEVKRTIVNRGGKTFVELHPDVAKGSAGGWRNQWQPLKESPEFSYNFNFYPASDITERRREKYIELFEAAWSGDLEKIKSLTLVSWDAENNEPPLQISLNDGDDSPFSLAYKRGHFDVAKAILEIARAQYAPEEKPTARYRMQTDEETEDSEVDSGTDDYEPKIYREIIDEQFTVENIGQVSLQVKSRIKPTDILGLEFPVYTLEEGKTELSCSRGSLLKHVILNNDQKGLQYYYDLTVSFAARNKDEDEENGVFVAFPQWAFWLAVRKGRLEMLANMIKWGGAGLPLEKLVKKTGLELKEIPKYYQGLSVYGKKRKDWATAGRRVIPQTQDSAESPLLYAARHGSMESVEWFLGDAPLRNYLDFGESKAAKEDARLKHLSQLSGGFEKAVTRWLGSQNDLVISAAILGPNEPKTERLVEYLIKVYPSSLESKCSNGMTPLFVACWLGRTNLVRLLITKGADQAVKDNHCDNVLHAALQNDPSPALLADFLGMLDPGLLSHLFRERSGIQTSDGRTPLHRWLGRYTNKYRENPDRYIKVLRLLLGYSKGQELNTLDAGGDTPLHTLIRTSAEPAVIKELLAFNPQLLYRENAVGRTVMDVAHDQFVQSCVPKPTRWHYYYHNSDRSFTQVLLSKNPEEFAREAREGKKKQPSNVQQIHDLVTELAGAHPGKRRLVSLYEANDVAKRVGETGQNQGWKGPDFNHARSMIRTRRARGLSYEMLEDGEDEEEDESEQHDVVSNGILAVQNSAWTEPKENI
ncbi:hypothetical protein VSDG_07762 [Cytospora chrysosperma]|uniref:Ankyrin repeat protein n=1 Tax=Cytospora chrysosperma TaxID=252740 RepID=A0A423VJY9_CYTCH|nr:hypothetical protein VSDG_07762 [Valsa sordida]